MHVFDFINYSSNNHLFHFFPTDPFPHLLTSPPPMPYANAHGHDDDTVRVVLLVHYSQEGRENPGRNDAIQ